MTRATQRHGEATQAELAQTGGTPVPLPHPAPRGQGTALSRLQGGEGAGATLPASHRPAREVGKPQHTPGIRGTLWGRPGPGTGGSDTGWGIAITQAAPHCSCPVHAAGLRPAVPDPSVFPGRQARALPRLPGIAGVAWCHQPRRPQARAGPEPAGGVGCARPVPAGVHSAAHGAGPMAAPHPGAWDALPPTSVPSPGSGGSAGMPALMKKS